MSKKFHKKFKEIQRLQSLHGKAINDTPSAPTAAVPTSSVGEAAEVHPHATMHQVIRQDIIFQMIVLAVMLVALFVLKWAVDHTHIAQSIFSLL